MTMLGRRDEARSRTADLGLLALRVGAGSMLAGHGAQKLFGAFHGPGIPGMTAMADRFGLRPAPAWALLSGLAEFGGGTLTAVGLAWPVGPIVLQGAMLTAIRRVHWKLPIWAGAGGAEVPLLYSLIGAALATTGPGRYSLDHALSVHLPRAVTLTTGLAVATGLGLVEYQVRRAHRPPATAAPPTPAATLPPAGEGEARTPAG